MAKDRTLKVTIVGDADRLNRTFTKASKDADKFGKDAETAGKRFSSSMKVAGAAAAGALAIGLKQSVSAAIEAEKSAAKLQAQLKASNISYREHAAAIEKSIQATSKLSGLDDEELADSFTNIVRVTGDVNEALRLNALAADFARAKNIDVARAGEIVGKVAGGNVGVLGRYGIKIKDGATATEALGALQEKFAGQAKAYGDTTAGAADRAKVGFENLQEVVGARLAPALAKVANKFADVAEWAQKNPEAFKAIALAVGGLVTALATLSIIGKVTAGVKALRSAMLILNASFLANPIVLVSAGLIALGAALVLAYRKSETFRRIVDAAFKVVKTVAVGALKVIVGGLDALAGAWSTMLRGIGKVPGFGWATKAANAIDKAREATRAWADGLNAVAKDRKFSMTVAMRSTEDMHAAENRGAGSVGPARRLGRSTGGPIPGTGRGDIVPMLGEPGEFVIQRKVVEKFGPTFFAKINAGQEPQRFTSGGIVARANRLDGMQIPYVYGGGHGTRDGFNRSGMDCSASVSYALGISPRVSGALMGFGSPGPGSPNDTKIYANPQHVFAVFNGRGWGTSRENPGGGPGWLSYNHRSGFTIRHLDDSGAAGSGTSGNAQEATESGKGERAGSRLVNSIAAKFSKGIGTATRAASAIGGVVEDAEGGYSRSERFFGQVLGGVPGRFGDEDLGTAEGRSQRTSELLELKKLKAAQLARLRNRMAALRRAIAASEKQLKALQKARGKAKGSKRAKMGERIRAFDDRLVDLKAEFKALGGQIADTQLDIDDLDSQIAQVAATGDTDAGTGETAERVAPTDALGAALEDVGLRERAGDLTPEQAREDRLALMRKALGGEFGNLNAREDLQVRGDLRELAAATTEGAQAVGALEQAVRELKQSMDEQNRITGSRMGIALREAERALADVFNRQLGTGVAQRSQMPGSGQLSRL